MTSGERGCGTPTELHTANDKPFLPVFPYSRAVMRPAGRAADTRAGHEIVLLIAAARPPARGVAPAFRQRSRIGYYTTDRADDGTTVVWRSSGRPTSRRRARRTIRRISRELDRPSARSRSSRTRGGDGDGGRL